jgi:hypothetical protein
MEETIPNFIRANHIDSFQKLRFLLFLRQNPEVAGAYQQFARRLYFSDLDLLKEIIYDLQKTNLLKCNENRCMPSDAPEVNSGLEGWPKRLKILCLAKRSLIR